ncbi:hypothetical protein [Halobacillus sp. Marseille-Q1614]|uniref:hypothetical protein n=1 Tax=Halobacillus sp. Marseille-Q1614 TaxID=2709134 RepID=UPI001570F1C9|nr:hypothetical protein [Halobacillus sp. Marseille-Q1614]
MKKHVEAFFKNENDAEGARAALQKVAIENDTIEAIPEQKNVKGVVPVLNQSGTSAVTGVAGFTDFLNPKKDTQRAEEDEEAGHLTQLLQFDVKEEDYQEALSILEENKAHMDQDKI